MKTIEKITYTILIISFFSPFFSLKKEIMFEGTNYEYLKEQPRYELFIIPYVILAMIAIYSIWKKQTKTSKNPCQKE